MSLRFFWKMLPKHKRELLVGLMGPIEKKQFKKIVENKLDIPECFFLRKSIFVHIPKTAGTSICDAIFGVNRLGHMPYDWYEKIAPELCEEYFTFGFVRNPWDRAVSAYHFLRSGGACDRDNKWSKLVKKFSSFDDFVLHWMCPENIQKQVHFIPQTRFVESGDGSIGLDYIGRFESLSVHLEELNRTLKFSEMPLDNISRKKVSERGDYREYYSDKSAEIIGNLYARDVDVFGYDF